MDYIICYNGEFIDRIKAKQKDIDRIHDILYQFSCSPTALKIIAANELKELSREISALEFFEALDLEGKPISFDNGKMKQYALKGSIAELEPEKEIKILFSEHDAEMFDSIHTNILVIDMEEYDDKTK